MNVVQDRKCSKCPCCCSYGPLLLLSAETFLRAFLLSSLLAAPYVIHSMEICSLSSRRFWPRFDDVLSLELTKSPSLKQQPKKRKLLRKQWTISFLAFLRRSISHEEYQLLTYLWLPAFPQTSPRRLDRFFFPWQSRPMSSQEKQKHSLTQNSFVRPSPICQEKGHFLEEGTRWTIRSRCRKQMLFWRYCHHDERESVNSICLKREK